MRNKILALLLFLVLILFTPTIDTTISRYFYQQGSFSQAPFFFFLYDYGTWPALFVGITSLLLFSLSFFLSSLKPWRKPALFLLTTLVLGAGIITNTLLKDHWGRPRPRQVEEFGGAQEFRPFYLPRFFDQPEPSRSFPCGHATMGFYFLSFYFVGKRLRKNWLAYTGVALGITLGIAIGWARVAQGGHFFSDVLFSALVMLGTAAILDWVLYLGLPPNHAPS